LHVPLLTRLLTQRTTCQPPPASRPSGPC